MTDHRSSASASRKAKPGNETIGDFVIGAEIGKGSFAQVYMGRHKDSNHAVAIKCVDLARLNSKLKENLYAEIQILKALHHPHIVALHDCVETKTHINLIMEYCELGDLSLLIKKRDKLLTNPATHDMARKYPCAPNSGLNEVVIRHFLKQLASALQFLRERNFVHRDVKPQNLLLLPSPQYREATKNARPILTASQDSLIPIAGLESLPMLKLADFGFARVLPSTALAETLCGSPLYMAPEILSYEKYDAKADLWSVGTVLYEMASGKPPFRANNHVELLKRIRDAKDTVKFPRECAISQEMKGLIRALLKQNPVERLGFEQFFAHPVVTGPIPGLVEEDLPRPSPIPRRLSERRSARDVRPASKSEEAGPLTRRLSTRRYPTDSDQAGLAQPPSPHENTSRAAVSVDASNRANQILHEVSPRTAYAPKLEVGEGLGIQRPPAQPSTSAPTRQALREDYRESSRPSPRLVHRGSASPISTSPNQPAASRPSNALVRRTVAEREKAAQDVAFERDYVVVSKEHVEVNAFADEMAANPRVAGTSLSPKSGQMMIRRATQQGIPTSATGAVPAPPSRALQGARGYHDRRTSLSASPGSATSFITKAIQDAGLRLLGPKYHLLGKGSSPPQLAFPAFPAYPTPVAPLALIGDGKHSAPLDEDTRVAQCIEDYATRSDVVYGFAEVKYKQLVPLAPSMDYGLGGVPAEKAAEGDDDDVLTIEAIVALSEEALVLYVKALSLLAKSMNIASLWWTRKSRTETSSSVPSARESSNSNFMAQRINSAVQWIRSRFNEVLEKAEVVRLKLVEGQKRLPEDHPSHPSNQHSDSAIASSTADGVFLSPGINAEKLMYDRALEMSRTAAINEITYEDLPGCEISYVTAIRMLEAVLDNDDDVPKRRYSSSKDDVTSAQEASSEMNSDDQQSVQKVIQMVTARLAAVRKKLQVSASDPRIQQQSIGRRRSGDVTPRSVPAHVQ